MKMRGVAVALFLVGCGGDPFVGALFEEADSAVELDGGHIEALDGGGTGGAVSTGGTGGAVSAGGASTGGQIGAGGTATGGAATGGSVAATGGASTGGAVSSGGTPSSGGAPGTGGVVACTPVTHSNGLGQTWQDCVPLGTHNATQALKACEAFTAASCPSARCILPIGACTDGNNSAEYTGDCGDGHILWTFAPGYQSTGIGHVSHTVCPTSQDPSWG